MNAVLQALSELARIDASSSSLEEELSARKKELAELQEGEQGLKSSLEGTERALAEAERVRGAAQQELRSSLNQVEQSREKMARVRSERENNAVGREIEELRRIVRDQEDEVRKLDALIAEYREKIEMTRTEMEQASSDLNAKRGGIDSRIAELESSIGGQKAAHDEAVAALPPGLFRKYETIRLRRGSGVATVTNQGTCTACHIALAPQLFHRLRRESIHELCPSCNRIIFYKPTVVASPEA